MQLRRPAAVCLCSRVCTPLPSPALQLQTLGSSLFRCSVTSVPSHHVALSAQKAFFWEFQKGHCHLGAGSSHYSYDSKVEISVWSHSGFELETYPCSSWNTRHIVFPVWKSKAAEEGWGRKEIKPTPPCQDSLWRCLMLCGGSCVVCPYKESAPGAENWVGRSQRMQGTQRSDYISVSWIYHDAVDINIKIIKHEKC